LTCFITRWRNNKRLITQNLKRSKHKSVVARRDISQETLVARHKFLVAPGRRAGDFASIDLCKWRKTIAKFQKWYFQTMTWIVLKIIWTTWIP
jgi:hypothetical protein